MLIFLNEIIFVSFFFVKTRIVARALNFIVLAPQKMFQPHNVINNSWFYWISIGLDFNFLLVVQFKMKIRKKCMKDFLKN